MYKGCTCGNDKGVCVDCMESHINKCDANQKNIEKLASDWFSQMNNLYDKYYNEDKNRWKIRQAEDVYKTLMLCRVQMLSTIGVKFIDECA